MKVVKYKLTKSINANKKHQINNTLHKIDGIKNVSINRTSGFVTVNYQHPATQDVIKNSIEHGGHSLK